MTTAVPTFGLWSDHDAVLWPERTHPPAYLTGGAFRVWDALARRGVPAADLDGALDPEAVARIVEGLAARGLLDVPPEPLAAVILDDEVVVTVDGTTLPVAVEADVASGWDTRPADGEAPALRVRALPDGSRLVAAVTGLPLTVAGDDRARQALVLAAGRLAHPSADRLAIPLEAWHVDGVVVLISPVLVDRPEVRAACIEVGATPADDSVTDLHGLGLTVGGETVSAFLLDHSWTAANPQGGPLALHWLLACLLSTCNPVAAAGRYALLDAAGRLVQERAVAWAAPDATDRVPDLLTSLPRGPR